MSGFIDSIVTRFNGADNIISPRLPGKFESSYNDESNLPEKTGTPVTPNDRTSALTVHDGDTQPSLNNGSRLFNTITSSGSNDQEKDFPFLNDRHKSIINTGDDHEQYGQKGSIQKENLFNMVIRPSQKAENSNGDFYAGTEIQQPIKNDPRINNVDTVMFPNSVARLVEKEKQHNRIDKPVIPQIVAEQHREDNTNIADPHLEENDKYNRAPLIKISIGKIEVRATPVTNVTKSKDHSAQKPKMSLEEYLQKRNKGQ